MLLRSTVAAAIGVLIQIFTPKLGWSFITLLLASKSFFPLHLLNTNRVQRDYVFR